eukprot:6255222-Amphidinium_carterae.1
MAKTAEKGGRRTRLLAISSIYAYANLELGPDYIVTIQDATIHGCACPCMTMSPCFATNCKARTIVKNLSRCMSRCTAAEFCASNSGVTLVNPKGADYMDLLQCNGGVTRTVHIGNHKTRKNGNG